MVRAVGLASALGLTTGCFGAALFPCNSDAECDRWPGGRCEDTGFCAYPDEVCPSGFAYDGLATPILAGSCVPDATTGSGTSTATSAHATTTASSGTGGTTGSTGETSSGGSTTGDCEPGSATCIDLDSDGYGVGDACGGPDCDDDNHNRHSGCRYIAPPPLGDNAASGTRDAPWATFAYAVPQLAPGDSLVLLDGAYLPGTTGMLAVDCAAGGAANGQNAGNPISVRAENDRAAYLESDGSVAAVHVQQCVYWSISGLAGRAGDAAGGASDVVHVETSSGIALRRLLFSHANRYADSAVLHIVDSSDVLVEDGELYAYHRHGARVSGATSEGVTLRRLYVNAREHEDLPVGDPLPYPTDPSYTGDIAFALEGSDHRLENVISDRAVHCGIALDASQAVRVEGSIVNEAQWGIDARSSAGFASVDHLLLDVVVLRASQRGVSLRSVGGVVVDGMTVIDSGSEGVLASELSEAPCSGLPAGCNVAARHVLSLDNFGIGVDGDDEPWTVAWSNAHGNAATLGDPVDYGVEEPIDDEQGHITASFSDPASGIGLLSTDCAAFVPSDSTMAGLGENGADIGANVLYRVVNGEVTAEPLWDPVTGAFVCGAIVEGVNDVAGDSCLDVHSRVNGAQCEFPAGYGAEPCD